MSQDPRKDPLLDHNYDGIQEYDNPMPRWWVWIFYITIAYSILYVLNIVPGLGIGPGRMARYEREIAEAEARAAAMRPSGTHVSEAQLLALFEDAGAIAAGKICFNKNCTPCHRADGGGSIGPNLTDEYWIHGGRPADVLKSVSEGVPAKGMPAWAMVLKPEELPTLVAYVMSLRDTDPPNPKAPQGTKEEDSERDEADEHERKAEHPKQAEHEEGSR